MLKVTAWQLVGRLWTQLGRLHGPRHRCHPFVRSVNLDRGFSTNSDEKSAPNLNEQAVPHKDGTAATVCHGYRRARTISITLCR